MIALNVTSVLGMSDVVRTVTCPLYPPPQYVFIKYRSCSLSISANCHCVLGKPSIDSDPSPRIVKIPGSKNAQPRKALKAFAPSNGTSPSITVKLSVFQPGDRA